MAAILSALVKESKHPIGFYGELPTSPVSTDHAGKVNERCRKLGIRFTNTEFHVVYSRVL